MFAAKGAGTVATGTLTGGEVLVDDELVVTGQTVRIRQIQQHGTTVDRAAPGERVALNLVGVDHHALRRGDALVRPAQWHAVTTADVAVSILPDATLKRRSRLRAAVGSGEQGVWCRRIDESFGRLRFDTPLPLAPGDRIVLRDSGTATTVAGAEVLEVLPAGRAAAAGGRLALPLAQRILADGWVPTAGLSARTGLSDPDARALLAEVGATEVGGWLAAPDAAHAARAAAARRARCPPSEPP